MAAESTAEEAEEEFRCFIHKFKTSLELGNAQCVRQSLQNKTLCILSKNGDLKCVGFLQNEVPKVFHEVRSFLLHNEDEPISQTCSTGLKLCILTTDNVISVYVQSGETFICEKQKNLLDLLPPDKGIKKLEVCELVGFGASCISLVANDQYLLTALEATDDLKLASCIELPKQTNFRSYQVILDIAVLYEKSRNKIIFYALKDGRKLSEVDMSFTGINLDTIQTWHLSTDLKIMLYVLQDASILHIDLELLSVIYPNKIASSLSEDSKAPVQLVQSNFRTSRYGDAFWKEKLTRLHENQRPSKSSPWYTRWKVQTTKADSGPSYEHRAKVTGFHMKEKHQSLLNIHQTPTRYSMPENLYNLTVEQVSIGPHVISMLLSNDSHSVLALFDVNAEKWTVQRLLKGEVVLLSHNPGLPHIVATETHLICIVTDRKIDQEHFVSELMVYGGASIADTLCHLNKWGRCSIPLTTLEVGLKHRQLDTVSFFLKSKEKLFSTSRTVPTSPSISNEKPSWQLDNNHHDNISQLEPALNMLFQSTTDSLLDRPGQHFAKQLLDIMIDFLYGLLLDAMSAQESADCQTDKDDLQQAIAKLLNYIESTRNCMKIVEENSRRPAVAIVSLSTGRLRPNSAGGSSLRGDKTRPGSEGSTSLAGSLNRTGSVGASTFGTGSYGAGYGRQGSFGASSFGTDSLIGDSAHDRGIGDGRVSSLSIDVPDAHEEVQLEPCWVGKDLEAVIEDGILTNRIPEVQKFLLDSGEDSKAGYSSIKKIGLDLALYHIRQSNLIKAKQLITNLGLDLVERLWSVALYTHEAELRASILKELQSMSALTPDQVSMVTFLQQLTALYPCKNFEALRESHHHVKDSETCEANRMKKLLGTSVTYDLTSECSSMSRSSTSSLHKIEDKGPSNESMIESFYDETDADTLEDVETGEDGYCEVLLDWIQYWDSETRDRIKLDKLINRPGSNFEKFSKEIIWKYLLYHNRVEVIVAWIQCSHDNDTTAGTTPTIESSLQNLVSGLEKISDDFVNHITPCPQHSKQLILQAFARQGVFDSDTLSDFTKLIQMIKTIGGLLQLPHPLASCSAVNLDQFHMDLVQHCVNQELPQYLWAYCTVHSLSPDFLYTLSGSLPSNSWYPVFMHFYALTHQGTSRLEYLRQTSLSNAVWVWGKECGSVGELIQQGHVMAALATLMYSPLPLNQVTFVTQHMEQFDGLSSEMVEQAIKPFPKLHTALFPASSAGSPLSDVSVYDLLMGNSSFDPRCLFGWQSTNTIAGEDAQKEMPSFSKQAMVTKYGYNEQLHYPYYLKQGRPTFAFVSFLAEEFKGGNPTIPPRRLRTAYSTALWIGVKNFMNPGIAASCVVFQELCGEDSLLLRTYLQVGNEIIKHKNNAVTGTMDKRREQLKKNEEELVALLLGCVRGTKGYRLLLLHTLEAAILASLTRNKIPLTSFEAAKHWTIAVVLCQQLRLPYTTVFLESCAHTNKWLPFIWYAQLHQYPKEQLQKLLHLFSSQNLQEHLHYAMDNADHRASQPDQPDKKSVMSQKASEAMGKDVRSTLYSRIGLTKGQAMEESSTEEEEEIHQPHGRLAGMSNSADTEDSVDVSVTLEGCPSDVFGVVFAALDSKSSWKSLLVYSITLRNPLFAELAACLRTSVLIPCLCSWLVSMMDVTEHAQFLEHHGKITWRYSMQTLDALLDIYIKRKWGSTLVTAFDIFQPNSPLLPFLQFYAEFTEKRNYNTCRLLLDEFKEAVFHFRHDRSEEIDHSPRRVGSRVRRKMEAQLEEEESSFMLQGDRVQKEQTEEMVGDDQWLEQVTYRTIQYLLTSLPSVYEVTELLKLLESESITLVFTKEDADFRPQCQMMQIIQTGEITDVNFTALLSPPNSSQYTSECKKVMQKLIDNTQFDEARKFAAVAKIPADHVTIAQADHYKSKMTISNIWTSSQAKFKFYSDTATIFKKHSVSSTSILQYFQREVEETGCIREKVYLYDLCLTCVQNSDLARTVDQDTESQLFLKLWKCKIQQKLEQIQNPGKKEADLMDMFDSLKSANQPQAEQSRAELIFIGQLQAESSQPDNLTPEELKALHELLGEMLTKGQIRQCCQVASQFSVYSQDLNIVQTCISLSLGVMTLDTLQADMLHLLRTSKGESHRMSITAPVALLRNSSSISLSSNIQPKLDFLSEDEDEKITFMERLLQHCNHGQHICRRIITAFKIAAVLDKGYKELVSSEDFDVLRPLLKTHYDQRFRLAADFLSISALSPMEVAGFLSDAIIQSFQVSLGVLAGNQDMFLDPQKSMADFNQIVRLCQEPTLLGNRLLEAVATTDQEKGLTSSKVLTLQTELLILSHECYTTACNMEGISNILRAARVLTVYLNTAHEYTLMTRLLTGVGRYNEMIYVFEALQQNHQFELLLGKGMDKETKFRTAILDYLKRYHPTDTDTYTMVALKFMMYREIAQLLQHNANKILNRLKGKPLENNSETSENLQKAAQYLSEAAESYIKDNCLRHAQDCIRQARLVALQIKYLPSNQQFINLTTKGANLLITEHRSFSEAFIISEAYGRRDNWGPALCENVLINGDMKYLQEFKDQLRVTSTLVTEAVDKYQQLTEKPLQGPANIKRLVTCCKDIKLQYRIAKELGIRDLVTSLEKSDSRSYLKDVTATP